VLLIRHATHDLVGKALAGRMTGLSINAAGEREASALATRLATAAIAAIYVSPQPRARETALPLAERVGLSPRVETGIDEIDFGSWTGRAFTELTDDPAWPVWVERRSIAQPPGGERFEDVQRRVVAAIERLRHAHPDETIALVSHGDLIKAALAHFLGMSLDNLERFDIEPASVSVVALGEGWAQVKRINCLTAVL
jgi:probable phosphoglycerate mutase